MHATLSYPLRRLRKNVATSHDFALLVRSEKGGKKRVVELYCVWGPFAILGPRVALISLQEQGGNGIFSFIKNDFRGGFFIIPFNATFKPFNSGMLSLSASCWIPVALQSNPDLSSFSAKCKMTSSNIGRDRSLDLVWRWTNISKMSVLAQKKSLRCNFNFFAQHFLEKLPSWERK